MKDRNRDGPVSEMHTLIRHKPGMRGYPLELDHLPDGPDRLILPIRFDETISDLDAMACGHAGPKCAHQTANKAHPFLPH
ncbi:hypothetical protein SAMN05421720_101240 [Rhodospira trueperi]|uniref:Uncharacterized protein n=1 Tax=Rhodospira trueperi TaxID=69960 RepID=A0A1G6WQW7_9PROT|nr:hypothetical protein SAMN05421720_101240 [Rhodospira trueperi]